MTTETLSQIVVDNLKAPDLATVKINDSSYWLSQVKAAVSIVPVVGGALAEELQLLFDYKTDGFFRKFAGFLLGLRDASEKERQQFISDIQRKAKDEPGQVIYDLARGK